MHCSTDELQPKQHNLSHHMPLTRHQLVPMQVVMPDAEYREQANELAIALSEPHVKGVFEERLPLDLHAALQLGCVTAVIPESRSKSMQDGFDLTDLQVHFAPCRNKALALSLALSGVCLSVCACMHVCECICVCMVCKRSTFAMN